MIDDDVLPDRPTPADLARVPAHELAETHGVFVHCLVSGRPRPPAERADTALYALAAGQAVVERIRAQRAALVDTALAAGAAPHEVAAALGDAAADPLDTLTGGAR